MEKLPSPFDLPSGAVVAGVDLGGTRLRVGLVDAHGTVLRMKIVPSATPYGPAENGTYLATIVEDLFEDGGITQDRLYGVGFGTSGPVDIVTGLISNPYTLAQWSGAPLRVPLQTRLGVKVSFENDASVAALGEFWLGAGAGSTRMVMVTVGTGIGGALVIDGRLYTGTASFHPEMGHQLIDPSGPGCYCGLHGCWEQLIAGPAIARDWSVVCRGRGGRSDVGAEDMFAAARSGDVDAADLVRRVGRYLGLGLVNVTAFLAPDAIVIGGGVSEHFDMLAESVATELERVRGLQPPGGVQVRRSSLGEEAGILGAAYLALDAVVSAGSA